MSIYAALVTLLVGNTDAQDRVYPSAAPSKPTLPYIVYTRIAASSENVLSGNAGLVNTRMQIDVYGQTYVQAQAVADAVDALMRGWTQQNVSNPAIDLYEPDVRLHRVVLDYSIWHP